MEGIYARIKNQLSDFFEKISSGLSDPKTLRKVTKKYHFCAFPEGQITGAFGFVILYHVISSQIPKSQRFSHYSA